MRKKKTKRVRCWGVFCDDRPWAFEVNKRFADAIKHNLDAMANSYHVNEKHTIKRGWFVEGK